MTLFTWICAALSTISTAALIPACVDRDVWRAVRGRWVRSVETTAAVSAALVFVALVGVGWVVSELAAYHRSVGAFEVNPWHA